MFRDLQEKYGRENVAHIVTFGRMTAKAVVKKVMSAFGVEQYRINYTTKLIEDSSESIELAMDKSPELRQILNTTIPNFPEHKYYDVISVLENVISHEGMHAGGIVICENLSSYAPVKRDKDSHLDRIIHMDKYMVEAKGFFKFDVLGLVTVNVVEDSLLAIKANHNRDVVWNDIDWDDKDVYDLLKSGDVSGIFQVANQAGKVIEQGTSSFLDLIALNALIRPDTEFEEYIERSKGKKYYIHPDRVFYMQETYGLYVYQEQYLLDAKVLCGWTIAFADKNIRKNKHLSTDKEIAEKFIKDGVNNGYDKSMMEELWTAIVVAASSYSFCKAHATVYALLAFQTAWLKVHYPIEYYAALLTRFGDDQAVVSQLIAECKQKGLNILPPDINTGTDHFIATKDGIQYRLNTISTVGEKTLSDVYKKRPFTSFEDLLERRSTQVTNKANIINFIKAGALSFTGKSKAELLWEHDMSMRKKTQIKNNYQCDRYPEGYDHVFEHQALGMYLTNHPLQGKGDNIFEVANNQICKIYGYVIELVERKQKNGKMMAFATLDTCYGNVRVLIFAHDWSNDRNKYLFTSGDAVVIQCKKSGDSVLFDKGRKMTK